MSAFRWIAIALVVALLSTLVPATVMAEERVDVAATVSSTSVEAVEGEEATVTVTISNIGPIPAPTVRFQFETQGVASVTISQGTCYEGRHPRAGQCDIGTMAVGQTVTLTYRHRGTGSQVVEFGAWSDDLNDINRRNNYLKVRIAYRNPFDPPVSVRESTSYTPTSRPMLGELQYYRTYTPRRVAITTGRDVELRWNYESSAYAGNYPQGPGPEWIPRDIFLIGVQWQLQIWQNAVANSGYNAAQEISALQRMIAQANQYPPGTRLEEYLKYKADCRMKSEGCWTDEYRQQVADEQARAAKPPPPIWGNNARPAVQTPSVQPPPPPAPPTPAKPTAVPATPTLSAPPKPSVSTQAVTLQMPIVTAPTNLFTWPRNTAFFAGRGVAGATVFVRYENSSQSFSGAVSSNGNWAVEVPVADGSNKYRVWAEKDGQKSRDLTFEFTRGSWYQQHLELTGQWIDESPGASSVFRVVSGDPATVGEFASSLGLDLAVFGDARDLSTQTFLFILNDPDFNPAVLGFAGLGLLTTGQPNDALVSATKNVYKAIAKLAKRSAKAAKAAEAVLKTTKAIHALGGDVPPLSKVNALKALLKLALEDSARLITYVDIHGTAGIELIQKMIGKFPGTKFRASLERLTHVWEDNPARAEQLKNLFSITKKEELSAKLEAISRTGRKAVYKHYDEATGAFKGDRFGFFDESRGVFTSWDENGQFVTAFPSDVKYFERQRYFFELP